MDAIVPHRILPAHESAVSYCTFIDDSRILTSSHDKTLKLWAISEAKMLSELDEHSNRVVACSMNMTDQCVLSGSWDRTIIYWDLQTCKSLWRGQHSTFVVSCDIHPLLHLAVSGRDDGYCMFWDIRSGKDLHKLKAHSDTITSCKISENGLNMCTTSMDSTVYVWDLRAEKPLITLRDHSGVITNCDFSHNNLYLATSSWDKTVNLYDITVGSYRSKGPTTLQHHQGCVTHISFSKDDSLLLSCGCDKIISAWDMNTRDLKCNYKGHGSWVYCSRISDCKRWITSGAKDGELRIWDTEQNTGERIVEKDPPDLSRCPNCSLACIPPQLGKEQTLQCVLCRLKQRRKSKHF